MPFSLWRKLNGRLLSKGNGNAREEDKDNEKYEVEQGAGAEDSEEEVATPQVVGTHNAIPSKFTLIERKETAPANPLEAYRSIYLL